MCVRAQHGRTRAKRAWAWPAAIPLAVLAPLARAHDRHGGGPPDLGSAWSLSPWLLLPLALCLGLYAAGLARLWRGGLGRGIRPAEAAAFAAGAGCLFLATVWPLDAYGEWSLAAHMAQHMLLLALVPPLLLAGRPLAALASALPATWARGLHRAGRPLRPAAGALAAAAVAHSAAMWAWHLPAALELALARESVHWAMHASFLAAGLWFWSALWRCIREPRAGAGPGVVAIVAVMMQMGFLGALLTFAPRVLYPVYALRAPEAGLAPLADQQLAGVLMWVPSCLPYLAGAVWLTWRGLARLDRLHGPG